MLSTPGEEESARLKHNPWVLAVKALKGLISLLILLTCVIRVIRVIRVIGVISGLIIGSYSRIISRLLGLLRLLYERYS